MRAGTSRRAAIHVLLLAAVAIALAFAGPADAQQRVEEKVNVA